MEILESNEELQKEATAPLKENNIVAILENFGEVIFGGSYVYGTMVDRDIDIAVVVEKNIIRGKKLSTSY